MSKFFGQGFFMIFSCAAGRHILPERIVVVCCNNHWPTDKDGIECAGSLPVGSEAVFAVDITYGGQFIAQVIDKLIIGVE